MSAAKKHLAVVSTDDASAMQAQAVQAPVEAERMLLGGLMLEGSAERVLGVAELVEPADFYAGAHKALATLLWAMARDKAPVEMIAVVGRIQATGRPDDYNGLGYVSSLPDSIPSTENLDYYARTVREAALRRRARYLGAELADLLGRVATDPSLDLPEVLARAVRRLEALRVSVGALRAPDGPDPLVLAELSLDDHRNPRPTLSNVSTIFLRDPRWLSLRLNQLGDTIEWEGKTWEQGAAMRAEAARWLAAHYKLEAQGKLIEEALLAAAQGRAYHPVATYLQGLTWDGEPRIARLLDEVLGVQASPLLQGYVRRFLISAVARALAPGCKVDTALILVGSQGAGKSRFFRALFGAGFFGDSPIPIGDKDAAIQLRAVWGYEAAEMEDLSRKTAEAVKQFLSSPADLYRAPYERNATSRPRHSVLCGSTNRAEFLTDDTGSRRFWPITVPDSWLVRVDLVAAWRDQLWAEARAAYEAGERWWFERDEEAELGRAEDVALYQEHDPWEGRVADVLRTVHAPFKAEEVMGWLKLDLTDWSRANLLRVTKMLTVLGYQSITFKPLTGPEAGRKVRRWWHARMGQQQESWR